MPKRLVWLTDIHLDFVEPGSADLFIDSVVAQEPDVVLVTGDIAIATTLKPSMEALAERVRGPVYFVLGNHDFYQSTIEGVRSEITQGLRLGNLLYLSSIGIVQLDRGVALVGHDGWADGKSGDYANSQLELTDFRLIGDYLGLDRWGRYRVMERLAEEAARHFERFLPEAAACNRHVIVATHVPPFPEAALYQGHPASPDGLPFFASPSIGEILLKEARDYPSCQLTILCGHTHEAALYRPAPNLEVRVAGAEGDEHQRAGHEHEHRRDREGDGQPGAERSPRGLDHLLDQAGMARPDRAPGAGGVAA